jgi:hypothetical protein
MRTATIGLDCFCAAGSMRGPRMALPHGLARGGRATSADQSPGAADPDDSFPDLVQCVAVPEQALHEAEIPKASVRRNRAGKSSWLVRCCLQGSVPAWSPATRCGQ